MQNSKTIPTKKQVQKYIHGAFFKSYPVKKLRDRKPGLSEAMSRKTSILYFLYSSKFSSDLPLYILDGVKQVVPLCTITLGLYVPIWQTPPSSAALKPTSRLWFTLELQSKKYWKISKLAKCGKTHQVVMLLAEAPEMSFVKDNFLKYIFIWEGEFWRSPHEHAWNSMTRGNPSPPT